MFVKYTHTSHYEAKLQSTTIGDRGFFRNLPAFSRIGIDCVDREISKRLCAASTSNALEEKQRMPKWRAESSQMRPSRTRKSDYSQRLYLVVAPIECRAVGRGIAPCPSVGRVVGSPQLLRPALQLTNETEALSHDRDPSLNREARRSRRARLGISATSTRLPRSRFDASDSDH